MEVAVYSIDGKDTGRKVVLNDDIFGIEPNDHAIYLDVKQYLADQRQGTHKAKEKGENSHSTRKLKRQKGTGGARAGSLKSPLYPGGGRVFGPQPRDYSFKLNKKLKCLARVSALAYKAKENNIMVIEDLKFDAPKTKQFAQICKNLKIEDKKSLFILSEQNDNVYLSSRNLQKSSVITICDINTYGIMNAAVLVFGESAINALQTNE